MWRKPTETHPNVQPSSALPASSLRSPESPQVTSRPTVPASLVPAERPRGEKVSVADSRIGPGLRIRGECSGNEDFCVDGEVQGTIRLTGARLTVGEKGSVQADVEAREIIVGGMVQGNLRASERLRLGASSDVRGDLQAPCIGIEDGARFHGRAEVTRGTASETLPAGSGTEDADSFRPVSANAE